MDTPLIRPACERDMSAVSDIYNHFVRTSTATFQIEPESLAEREEWFQHRSAAEPVIVLVVQKHVLAWAALSLHNDRGGYGKTADTSVYVRYDRHRRGYGRAVLADLIRRGGALGYHTLLACCCSEAYPSIVLHEALGFRKVGHFREVGRKFERWLDVVYLQLFL